MKRWGPPSFILSDERMKMQEAVSQHTRSVTEIRFSTGYPHHFMALDKLTPSVNNEQIASSVFTCAPVTGQEGSPPMKYQIFKDKAGEFRWRLVATNGKIVADSGEGYRNKADCLHGIDLVKSSTNAEVEEPTT